MTTSGRRSPVSLLGAHKDLTATIDDSRAKPRAAEIDRQRDAVR